MTFIRLAVQLADPRGRCNRTGFLTIAFAMLGVQIACAGAFLATGTSFEGPIAGVLNAVFFWLVTAAISKRLHDLGLSAWWILKAAIAIFLWSVLFTLGLMLAMDPVQFEPGGPGYYMAVGGTTVPVFVGVLWLHFVHGQSGDNVYGPEPAGWGLSHPA